MRVLINVLSIVSLIVLAAAGSASAHGGHDHSSDDRQVAQAQSGQQSTKDYTYITPVNGSLSEIVRKALQQYDQDSQDITLTPAQIVAAETAIVQSLGERLLEIGERVTVSGSLLRENAAKARALDAATLAEWQLYAMGTDFDTSHIQVVTADASDAASGAEDKRSDTKQEAGAQTAPDKDDQANAKRSDDRNSAYWLLLPVAVAALAYVVGRSNKNSEPAVRKSSVKNRNTGTSATTKTAKKKPARKK